MRAERGLEGLRLGERRGTLAPVSGGEHAGYKLVGGADLSSMLSAHSVLGKPASPQAR